MRRVAALYVQHGGVYFGVENVDPWALPDRDARSYDGSDRVVAHPPCSAWCKLAPVNAVRYGHAVGADGGCFESALAIVRRNCGVLEHPAYTYAWKRFGLPRPVRRTWTREPGGPGWVCEVSQAAYGHAARKLTWLYCVSAERPADMDWLTPEPSMVVSWLTNMGSRPLPRMSKKAASRTPLPFRDALISLARAAVPLPA